MEQQTDTKGRSVFGGWALAIFWAGMFVFAGYASTHMVAAGDTWVAMACGRHHVNHGVDTVEPFSANSHKAGPTEADIAKWPGWARSIAGHFDIKTVQKWHPTGWVNQNWLSHVIFYKLAKTFGGPGEYDYNYNALVVWKFAIYFIMVAAIYFTARIIGVCIPLAAAAASFALYTGRTFLDIRPAGYANVLVAVYMLILALTVYKNRHFIWLMVPMTVFWGNVHGGYLYVFIMMVPFIGLHLISCVAPNKLVSIKLAGVYETVAAAITALIAMVLFNPFHLTNLTHTFEISISEHAESWRTVKEWRPAFEWSNKVGSAKPFLILFILIWVVLLAWIIVRFLKPASPAATKRRARQQPTIKGNYQWPKIDLAMIAIAAITVYMAVDMRRFIPIGAAVACPVLALMIQQAVQMVAARINFNRTKSLNLPAISPMIEKTVTVSALIAVIVFGSVWGAKFKRIYLDPWPNDDIRDSVFMRMTASNVKPFDVTKFLRDNEVSGKMFNYWTEGGAIAFGQAPDKETGKTPLQLFMDGRAQAAYDHSNFLLWQKLQSGGVKSYAVKRQNRFAKGFKPSGTYKSWFKTEMGKIAVDMDREMKNRDIWVLLMPKKQFVKPKKPLGVSYLPHTLAIHPEWKIAYMDEYQMMYIDITNEKGKELFREVTAGKAIFPNEFSKGLTLSRHYLKSKSPKIQQKGFDLLIGAFKANPCRTAMYQLVNEAGSKARFRKKTLEFAKNWLDDFEANADEYNNQKGDSKNSEEYYINQKGYFKKLDIALFTANYLAQINKKQNKELSKKYYDAYNGYLKYRGKHSREMMW